MHFKLYDQIASAYKSLWYSRGGIPLVMLTDSSGAPIDPSESGGTGGIADSAAFTEGTTNVVAMGAIYDQVAGAALVENHLYAPRLDAKRALFSVVEDGTTRGRVMTVNSDGSTNNVITAMPGFIRSAFTPITMTLTGVANAAMWQSLVVDNTVNAYVDATVAFLVKMNSVAPTAGTSFSFYSYGSVKDDGAGNYTYPNDITGTNASYTDNGQFDELFRLATVTVPNTASREITLGGYSVRRALGVDILPPKWGLVFRNDTAQTTDATGANNFVGFYGWK